MQQKGGLLLKKSEFKSFLTNDLGKGIVISLSNKENFTGLNLDFFQANWDGPNNRILKGNEIKLSFKQGYNLTNNTPFTDLGQGEFEYNDRLNINNLDFCFIFNVQLYALLTGVEEYFIVRGVPFVIADTLGHREYFNLRFYAMDGPAAEARPTRIQASNSIGNYMAVSAIPCPPYWYPI